MGFNSPHIDPTAIDIVQEPAFIGIVWTCVGLSFFFVAFRFYVHLSIFHRVFEDDALVLLAWLILFTCTTLWHVNSTLDFTYLSIHVGFGTEQPTPAYLANILAWTHTLFAEQFLNIIGLWAVKFAFLGFFRRLGYNVQGQKTLWWVITTLTVIAMAISIGVIYYPCIFTTLEILETFCPLQAAGDAIYQSFRIQFGCDFATDLILLTIPIWLLRKVQIHFRRKVAILGMFFLTLITMAISLTRIIVGLRGPREDNVWFFFCGTIELTLSIMMACAITFPRYFRSRENSRTKKYSDLTEAELLRKKRSDRNSMRMDDSTVERTITHSDSVTQSDLEALPLDVIHRRDDIEVYSHPAFQARSEKDRAFGRGI